MAALLRAAWLEGERNAILAVTLYACATITMFSVSFAYHHLAAAVRKDRFRSFDHAAIFTMIAGTYTPFAVVAIGGVLGHSAFVVIWFFALFGAIQRLRRPVSAAKSSVWPYLAMGWMSLPFLGVLLYHLSNDAILFLVLGGVIYTVGVIFHRWETLRYQNAIWHVFVLVAAGCHYVSIRLALGLG